MLALTNLLIKPKITVKFYHGRRLYRVVEYRGEAEALYVIKQWCALKGKEKFIAFIE